MAQMYAIEVEESGLIADLISPILSEFEDVFVEPTGLSPIRIHRKFVKGYGTIAKPFTDLLKKDEFGWNEVTEDAFQNLKVAMSTTPVLALSDFNQPSIIEIDACYGGIGVVLMQGRRPLAYSSKALGPRNLRMSIYEKELLALVFIWISPRTQ
ncbi:Uncharacterized protein Adt_22847 [Abeliophyllum distichum]|uniref:Reverse transcriptase/retrotransposon-derived protein RNase H-like domain-containing protein n=1 Tax=Abeliophyllum distichum TaxID=126358 RepID=A0ABD1S988_9LAMI